MAEARIKLLKGHRANSKRMLKNFEFFLDKFESNGDFPILEKRSKELDEQRELFNKCQSELETLGDEVDSESIRTDFDERYYAAYSRASVLKLSVSRLQTNNSNNVAHASDPSASNSNVSSVNELTRHKSKLPSLNLPTFEGSYATWLGFHDLFMSLVDNDPQLTDIEKLLHLKGCLRNEAAEIVTALDLSSENYTVAWELLKNRYDNRRLIRESHFKELLKLPVISREFSVRALHDQTQKHVRSLKALGESVDSWDLALVVIIKEKFNNILREKWSDYSSELDNPTYSDMINFLQRRAQIDDTQSYHNTHNSYHNTHNSHSSNERKLTNFRHISRSQQSYTSTANLSCSYCKGNHWISGCEKFRKLSPQERYESVKKLSLCLNCLRSNHRVSNCSFSTCRTCTKKHHTLLHFESTQAKQVSTSAERSENSIESKSSSLQAYSAQIYSDSLLATAIVDIVNAQGKTRTCRVFLDSGSQPNFITEEVVSFLNLPKKSVDVSVSGIKDTSTDINYMVSAILKSRCSNFCKNLSFFVLSQITQPMPSRPISLANLEIPKNISLADPKFHVPSRIDLLLGTKLFYKLLCVGQIVVKNHPDLVLQKTHLGWIVAGEFNDPLAISHNLQCHLTIHPSPLESNLSKFWEIEELPASRKLSTEEKACEQHYVENTVRNSDGRYVVRLPFNKKKCTLGESMAQALRRFQLLEKRLINDNNLKLEYCTFLEEYESLGHLSIVEDFNTSSPGFYLPHHAVVKNDSLTTKIRVVFDGSAKSSSGISLNETLMNGPTIQDDLFSILVRFRSHKIALTADIEKMYRQVLVHPADANFQRILFRSNPQDSVKTYKLNTVTYGTTCAPFLAIRTLHQLADDEAELQPVAAALVKRDFYVDDLLTGADTQQEACFIRDELVQLLKKGGFILRKWASNDPTLVSDNLGNFTSTHMSLDPDSTVKTLGLQWNCREDCFSYSVDACSPLKKPTKRLILSRISKLFDPLGLLGPVILKAKLMIQILWKAGVSWDESVPFEVNTMWNEYQKQLSTLRNISFDRYVLMSDAHEVQIHGFCDASEQAYGACIYFRSKNSCGKTRVSLVCSKSRVAPLKLLTLPRLELCAALLLSRLIVSVKQALQINFSKVVLWSDSTIALNWIAAEPYKLKTFVSNRITEIQELTANCQWRHVPSLQNPADLVSRGQLPQEFINCMLWKKGPEWLSLEDSYWPPTNIEAIELPEKHVKSIIMRCLTITINKTNILQKYSSIGKLTRVMAYANRFVYNFKNKPKRVGILKPIELETATHFIIRFTQSKSFAKEIEDLKCGRLVDKRSSLLPLNPFLDKFSIS